MQKKLYLCTLNMGQMKIIGFIYRNGKAEMVLKGDSCLLNGRKPFFVPDWTNEVGVTDCIILRVCRLGKEIAPKFADRYYDAIAPGADFIAMDRVQELQAAGRPWTSALGRGTRISPSGWILPATCAFQTCSFPAATPYSSFARTASAG